MDDLLKEAIADAKAVRETALENAKIALEEAFTPRLQSMLSKKIQSEMDVEEQEDEMEDEEEMEEPEQAQPQQPAHLEPAALSPFPRLFEEEIEPGPEQKREQRAHLAVDEDELRNPHPTLRLAMRRQKGVWIHVSGKRLAEGDDIRREDTHHSNAANEIEARDPIGRGAERCCMRLRLVG